MIDTLLARIKIYINKIRYINYAFFNLYGYTFLNLSKLKIEKIAPNLIILGAMKSGTTDLFYCLSKHPSIFCSNIKESGYYLDSSDEKFYPKYNSRNSIRKGLNDSQLIKKMILGYSGERYICDGSTHYTKLPEFGIEVPNKIKNKDINPKFIYIIRNPIDRIISQYYHSRRANFTNLLLEEEINSDILYLSFSKYYYQLKNYIELFGANKIHIIFFEDFVKNKQIVMNKVFDFLDLNPIIIEDSIPKNISNNKEHIEKQNIKLSKELYQKLISELSPDIALLEKSFNIDAKKFWFFDENKYCK